MMNKQKFAILLIFFALSRSNLCALADDFELRASVDSNKAIVGSAFNLSLTFSGTRDLPVPDLKRIEGFDWRYAGPATRISIINGARSSSITHNYILTPLKAGSFAIPGFEVEYKGKIYISEPINMDVSQYGPVQESCAPGDQGQSEKNGFDKRIFLILQPGKRQVYTGEKFPVSILLYVNNVAVRDIQYPKYVHEGFLSGKFSEPSQYTRVANGLNYNVVEFNTDIYGLYPGRFTLGPAEIACNLVYKKATGRRNAPFFGGSIFNTDAFEDLFGGYESRPSSFKTEGFDIEVIPLPAEGRPDGFSGAVGRFTMSAKVSSQQVNAGDPITLTVEIEGSGNFDTVLMPDLGKDSGFKRYEPEVSQASSRKCFQQVIIPVSDSVKEIPAVSFSYFDPAVKMYKVVTQPAIPVEVVPLREDPARRPTVSSAGTADSRDSGHIEALGRDIVYIKEGPGLLRPAKKPFCFHSLFFAAVFVPFILVLSTLIIKRRRARLDSDIKYARKCRAYKIALKNIKELRNAIAKGSRDRFFERAIKALKEYLGDKFHLPAAGMTKDIVSNLRRDGVADDIIKEIEEFFNICDMARYAPLKAQTKEMTRPYELFKSIVDKLERSVR
ncbi:MAG: BatD family protein [Candidatus Omnitrophota bacterium]